MKSYFLNAGICCMALFLYFGCTNSVNPPRHIKQANLVHEDNVNGRIASGNVEESTNFYYNPDESLGRVSVYNDTTVSAILLKDITVEYLADRVVLNTFDNIDGYRTIYLFYNSQKQITSLVDTLGNGLYFTYVNDKIESLVDSSGAGIVHYINFVYDVNNNLLQYEAAFNNDPPIGRAVLEYSNDPITEELDTRFFNKNIKFIYIGGLNLVTKLGLNFGLSNSNTLISRTERLLATGDTVDYYRFGYIYNHNHEIVKRNMRWGTDTLFYQFKY